MKKNTCLIYSWENFSFNYLQKDVGLFPKFFAKSSEQKLDAIIYDSVGLEGKLDEDFDGELYKSKSYLHFIFEIFSNRIGYIKSVKYFILFHVSLRTSLLSILLKLVNPSSKIIVKTDLSVSNLHAFSNMRMRNPIKYYLILILNRVVDAFCIETTGVIELLNLEHSNLIKRDKVYHVPNGVLPDDLFLKSVVKDEHSISIITRDDTLLKGYDRIIPILKQLDRNLSCAQQGYVVDVRIIGPLSVEMRNALSEVSKDLSKIDIHLLGSLSAKSTLAELSKSQLFVNLSLEESYCFALVEAALTKCTVITTPVGVAEDLSKHYPSIEILNFNVESFVQCIISNLENSQVKITDSILAEKKTYDWEKLVEGFYIEFSKVNK
ncbi:hypothetical protein VCR4J2_510037 [Vibrio coralliirubri]|uniref:glycosyltransferase n=1 Tax=Vibrio coralliirubri TaxID=1516159 RepID=UPI000639BE8A|nr:glycosyltransferase [Vibrio coralliirubri]CDT40017.1 hypothetical protein VCR4J2_510037 [Vibrio coralliirubri]